jgi:hypothetical protein
MWKASVIESIKLGEDFLKLCEGMLIQQQLWNNPLFLEGVREKYSLAAKIVINRGIMLSCDLQALYTTCSASVDFAIISRD